MKTLLSSTICTMLMLTACSSEQLSSFNSDGKADARVINTTVELGLGVLGAHPKNNRLVCEDDQKLNTSWYYQWNPKKPKCPEGYAFTAQFIPMIWNQGHIDRTNGTITDKVRKQANESGYLLGFNEPDGKGQADMTVEEALMHWPALEQQAGDTYLLGSPAPKKNGSVSPQAKFASDKAMINHDWSDDGLIPPEGKPSNKWLPKFMVKAAQLGLRVDFMALHYYYYCEGEDSNKSYNPKKARYALKKWLRQVSDLYQKPIWITEFSCLSSSLQANVEFVDDAMSVIEQHNLDPANTKTQVERVAWFSNRKSKWGGYYKHTHLVDFDGKTQEAKLTRVGEAYKKHGRLANTPAD